MQVPHPSQTCDTQRQSHARARGTEQRPPGEPAMRSLGQSSEDFVASHPRAKTRWLRTAQNRSNERARL